jgi:hypothetical protein
MSLVIVGAGPNLGLAIVAHTAIAGRIAPGGDHEPADVAGVLWSHHAERGPFQTPIGF